MAHQPACCGASRAEELQKLVQKASGAAGYRAILDWLRTNTVSRPDLEFEYGMRLIRNHRGSLGSDVWLLYERTLKAALHTGHIKDAEACLAALRAQFKNSKRIDVLRGMVLEGKRLYPEAEELYNRVIDADPTHMQAHKRLVALALSQGQLDTAVRRLNDYIKMYYADEAAWSQLMLIYTRLGSLSQARFCAEELLLMQPHVAAYNLRNAELCYSVGRADPQLPDAPAEARRYYCRALLLNPVFPEQNPEAPVLGGAAGVDGDQAELTVQVSKQLQRYGLRECSASGKGNEPKVHNMRALLGLHIASRQASSGSAGTVVRDLAKNTRQTLARAYQPGKSRAPAHLCELMQEFLQGRAITAGSSAGSGSAAVVSAED